MRLGLCAALLALAAGAWAGPAPGRVVLADFEGGLRVAGNRVAGWRPQDREKAALLTDGGSPANRFARFFLTPSSTDSRSVYLQYRLRRRYLFSGISVYSPRGPNTLVFRLRVPPEGPAVCRGDAGGLLGVWTYHWRDNDLWVGGPNGTSGSTDSMMHGYANLCVEPEAAGRWVRVVLSASAFRQQRDYYHFFAARGVTGDLAFFPSLRQLQLVLLGPFQGVRTLDLDDLVLEPRAPTARFEPDYVAREVTASDGEVRVPVTLVNPTGRSRRYRVFISSFLGASREALNRAFADADSVGAPTALQKAVGGNGGVGVAFLADNTGTPLGYREIEIPAGGMWRGTLVHRIRPEMLGGPVTVRYRGHVWTVRRDTLTTSVIAWDPEEPRAGDMARIRVAPSNADDGRHRPPPGFPPQERPPEGWRSADVPPDQVGGYLVTEIRLR